MVHAEGVAPDAEEKRYAQDALVALVETRARRAQPPPSSASRREGPLALLPLAGRYALVWSCAPGARARARRMRRRRSSCGSSQRPPARGPGAPVGVEARAVQPLALRVRAARIGERAVYIGNAAQTLHPVAGQGLNLGLRDAWELGTDHARRARPGRRGDARALSPRAAGSMPAPRSASPTCSPAIFSARTASLRAARGAALTALDVLPAPRRFFARRMIFGPSALP